MTEREEFFALVSLQLSMAAHLSTRSLPSLGFDIQLLRLRIQESEEHLQLDQHDSAWITF